MGSARVLIVVCQWMGAVALIYAAGVNEECEVRNLIGICVPLRSCPEIYGRIQQAADNNNTLSTGIRDYFRSFLCGYESNNNPLVCCNVTTRPTPASPSQTDAATQDFSRHRNAGMINRNCGKTAPLSNRIISGDTTGIFEFPWMARLKLRSWRGERFTCGGTLINNRYVLTAAHCLPTNNQSSLVSVTLGDHDYSSEEDCEKSGSNEICAPPPQKISVESTVIHPQYYKNGPFSNDIALVRLARLADLSTDTVRPICLPMERPRQTQSLEGVWMTVAGWGQTLNGTESADLLKVSVPVVSTSRCHDKWQKYGTNIDTNKQLCAGDTNIVKGSCRGDSGGPFMTAGRVDSELRMVQYGIISYGSDLCGSRDVPVVYTRVDNYMKWILDNLRP